MFVRVLGPVAVGLSESDAEEAPGAVVAAVIAHLALARGRTVGVDDLVARVWDVPPEGSRNALQAAVSRARRSAGPDLIVSSRAGYRLGPSVVVDLVLAESRLSDARQVIESDPAAAAARAGEALALFAGVPLDGLQSLAAESARAALEELRLAVVLEMAGALVLDGRGEAAVPVLRHEIARHPLVEPLHAALMRALTASGRTGEAVEHYGVIRRRLASELGVDPSPELAQAFDDALAGRQVSPRSAGRAGARVVLPPQRHLPVGRERDIATVLQMISAERLVTLVGLGGVGKTTLAVAVARARADGGQDDVVLVGADGADGTDAVLADVSRSWGGNGSSSDLSAVLRSSLAGRRGLLVLDSCEDVDLAADVEGLLDGVPGLSILATSRTPLGVTAEAVVRVRGLEPESARTLLEMRARRFGAADIDIEVADRLVAAVDGVPLGVELLAGRLADMTPAEVLTELEAARGARPMADVVEWSRDRLSRDAAVLLEHLSDLPDGIDPGLARHLVGASASGALTELVHSGLAHRYDTGRVVWRSPEMVRGHLRTATASSREDRAGQVLAHYVSVQEKGFHGFLPLSGDRRAARHQRANVATTLAVASPTPDESARMILLLMSADYELGTSDPAVVDLAVRAADGANPHLRGWLLSMQARRLHRENRGEAALAVCDEVCALAGLLDDDLLGAVGHEGAAHSLLALARFPEALERVDLAVSAADRASDSVVGAGTTTTARLAVGIRRLRAGCLEMAGASPDDVARAYEDALARARAAGRPDLVLTDLCTWAAHVGMDVLAESAAAELRAVAGPDEHYTVAHADISDAVRAWHRGDATALVVHSSDALERFRGSGDARWIAVCLWLLAEAASLLGDDVTAARILGARIAVQGEDDHDPDAIALAERVRRGVGERWASLEREGRMLSIDDATALLPR